jgi:glycosyltransferase involved in cell wall biosynthesis
MTCGTPIVTSKANGLEELAGDAALLVDPQNSAEVAEAAWSVLTDASLAEKLQTAGLERCGMFSWDTCARNTLTVLEEVGAAGDRTGSGGAALR